MCITQNFIIINNISTLLLLFFSLMQQENLGSISNRNLKFCSLNNHQYCHSPGSIYAKKKKKVSMGTAGSSVMPLTSLIPGVGD